VICRNHPGVLEGVRRCSRCGGPYCANCLVTIGDQPFCAHCKTEQLLDIGSGVESRQLVRYARFWPRFWASFLDGMIVAVPSVIGIAVIELVGGSLLPGESAEFLSFLSYLPAIAFGLLYEGLMLSRKNGQTLGKMALNIRVVSPDGSPIGAPQAWRRALVRVVLGAIFCAGIVDYLAYFFTSEKTTLHDMAGDTRVVDAY
jgi:uncharacterized RDD family membrane protein YckC